MVRERRLYGSEAASALCSLRELPVNYTILPGHAASTDAGWHLDSLLMGIAEEPPGNPQPGGAWEIACRLVRDYQFPHPGILRGLYRSDSELLGRDMLLEGRFWGLRFDMGVRVTSVIDEVRGTGDAAQRVWGWRYRTLRGHLEEGELAYEVIKALRTGEVRFRISGYSRRAPISNPVVRAGFLAFGRMTQRRFYRASANRLAQLTQAELHGMPPVTPQVMSSAGRVLVVAPSRTGPLRRR